MHTFLLSRSSAKSTMPVFPPQMVITIDQHLERAAFHICGIVHDLQWLLTVVFMCTFLFAREVMQCHTPPGHQGSLSRLSQLRFPASLVSLPDWRRCSMDSGGSLRPSLAAGGTLPLCATS